MPLLCILNVANKMKIEESIPHTALPWELSGEGYILNYWLSPAFTRRFQNFGLVEAKFGRIVQVILVRYYSSPVGPYDELLVLDHTTQNFKISSNIPKIYVSSQASVNEGRYHWGIPKELASFNWKHSKQQLHCDIQVGSETLSLTINLTQLKSSHAISSKLIPSRLLNIQQKDHLFLYQFSPKFKSKIAYISNATWNNTQSIFPDFSKATFLKGFYSTDFKLIFPESVKTELANA